MRLGSFAAFYNVHGFGAFPVCIDDLANGIDHELGFALGLQGQAKINFLAM
jgi:hypothetical protein